MEARGKVAAKGRLRMQVLSPAKQYRFTLHNVWVGHATVHRTHRRARFMIVKAHTFRTLLGHDVEDVVGERRVHHAIEFPFHPALVDGGVGALGLTCPTIDALTSNHRGHTALSPSGIC